MSPGFSFENLGEEIEDRDFELAERKVCASTSKPFLSSAQSTLVCLDVGKSGNMVRIILCV